MKSIIMAVVLLSSSISFAELLPAKYRKGIVFGMSLNELRNQVEKNGLGILSRTETEYSTTIEICDLSTNSERIFIKDDYSGGKLRVWWLFINKQLVGYVDPKHYKKCETKTYVELQ